MVAEIVGGTWMALQKPAIALAVKAAKLGVTKGAGELTKKAASAWEKFEWTAAEGKYRQKLLSSVKCTKVLGNPKPIEIDKIYTDVYVFDKLSAIRRYTETLDEDEEDVHKKLNERERINAKDIIKNGKNAFILGRPGAGKTTFLKYLAMSACRGLTPSTPMFVSLKDWSDSSLTLKEFLAKQFDVCGFPNPTHFIEAILESGKALVLLDGLDEVNEWQDKRNQIIKDIVDFSNKYSDNQYCLTCRTAATDYSFDRFDYVELADFSIEQQTQFASQWYGSNSKMLENFLKGWNDPRNSGLRDLGRTPLLLTLLCLSFDETHAFPRRQVDLYYEAINALLKKWDTSRLITRDSFYHDLSYGQRQQLLETIASNFYFESRTVFKRAEVAKVASRFFGSMPDVDPAISADGVEIVRQIEAQHGLIVERAQGLYTFSHLTIQEYFTASFIVKNQSADLQRQVVKSALNDQKWREVMIYTVAQLPSATSLLNEMLRQLLAMKVASTGVLIFIGGCFCTARLAAVGDNPIPGSDEYYLYGLKSQVDNYISKLRQPSLTSAELAKFAEHINVLHDFLKVRSSRATYDLATKIVGAALIFLKADPLDAARLLGGYFIKPDQFIGFFYACRLMMECIEVANTERRDHYLSAVLGLDSKDLERIEQAVRAR